MNPIYQAVSVNPMYTPSAPPLASVYPEPQGGKEGTFANPPNNQVPRIVEPFSIAVPVGSAIEETEILLYDPHNPQVGHIFQNDPHSQGVHTSSEIQRKVVYGTYKDGQEITRNDSKAAQLSTRAGQHLSAQLDARLSYSSYDRVDNLQVKHETPDSQFPYDITKVTDFRYDSRVEIPQTNVSNAGGGYQVNEYKSMYDTNNNSSYSNSNNSGGYQMSEYKSIYDK